MKKLPSYLTHCCKVPFRFDSCKCKLVCSNCGKPASKLKEPK